MYYWELVESPNGLCALMTRATIKLLIASIDANFYQLLTLYTSLCP